MNDDSFIEGEYTDYSNYELRHSNLNNEESATLKEINKLRYRYNMSYITEESYFSKIDNYDYYGFLTDSEMKELNRRHQEHKLKIKKKRERQILQKQYELKKKRQEEWKPVKFIISLILIIILILIGLID